MPVTFDVVGHPATTWDEPRVESPEDLLERIMSSDSPQGRKIVQTSVTRRTLQEQYTSASRNGFVWCAYDAYSRHHHLTIRPEDVWFAILTQLSFFINGNAEKLRATFVAHEGQKELVVKSCYNIETVDLGMLVKTMATLLGENVNDPDLSAWVMPEFSTTSDTDRVVAAALFMGAMEKYFTYLMVLGCGLPSVTLLGNVTDWQDVLERLTKLEQLGDEPTQFAEMLKPILHNMIRSFEQPSDPEVIQFWNTIATKEPLGSGNQGYISGWITAFCFWNENGEPNLRNKTNEIGRISYPKIFSSQIPVGFSRVPVKIGHPGAMRDYIMLAGSFGIQAQSSDDTHQNELQCNGFSKPGLVNIQPFSAWLIYEK